MCVCAQKEKTLLTLKNGNFICQSFGVTKVKVKQLSTNEDTPVIVWVCHCVGVSLCGCVIVWVKCLISTAN